MNEFVTKIREKRYEELGIELTAEFMRKMIDITGRADFMTLFAGLQDGSISGADLHKEDRMDVINDIENGWKELMRRLADTRKALGLPEKAKAELIEDGGNWMAPAVMLLAKKGGEDRE